MHSTTIISYISQIIPLIPFFFSSASLSKPFWMCIEFLQLFNRDLFKLEKTKNSQNTSTYWESHRDFPILFPISSVNYKDLIKYMWNHSVNMFLGLTIRHILYQKAVSFLISTISNENKCSFKWISKVQIASNCWYTWEFQVYYKKSEDLSVNCQSINLKFTYESFAISKGNGWYRKKGFIMRIKIEMFICSGFVYLSYTNYINLKFKMPIEKHVSDLIFIFLFLFSIKQSNGLKISAWFFTEFRMGNV